MAWRLSEPAWRVWAIAASLPPVSPSLRFRGQPFDEEETTGAFLHHVLGDGGFGSLTMVVAWARFGGLRRFKAEFARFREQGGSVRLLAGIDEGGATVPGLSQAIEVADEPYVFHDRQGRTFHPKLYLAERSDSASLLVGSSNLTAGGLFSNYEASLEARFDLPAEEADAALAGARAYVQRLLDDENLCLPLDRALLERLAADRRYAIAKRERRRGGTPGSLPPGAEETDVDQDGKTDGEGANIFGQSRNRRVGVPGLGADARAELERLEGEAGVDDDPRSSQSDGRSRTEASPSAVETWTKRLTASDAQHPPSPRSNPLGNMRLTKAGHDIPWLTWFRYELFGAQTWVVERDREENQIEVATVPFEVTVDGRSHGTLPLNVDHAPHRESGQSNHATVLHWGILAPVLYETNYTKRTLTIQRMSDGSYRLDISR